MRRLRSFDVNPAQLRRTATRLFLIGLLSASCVWGQATIGTIAGNGAAGFADGPALAASFNTPVMIDFGPDGSYYVADIKNNRIRKVDKQGNVTTVAGNGVAGFAGDGGPAVQASINGPTDVVVDSQGNLFIADAENQRIRKVDTNGIITTYAGTGVQGFSGDGGLATAAALACPVRLWVDSFRNLFVADQCNHRVRRITIAGTITTVVGTGSFVPTPGTFSGDGGPALAATFNNITAIALDGGGNMIVSDQRNHRIRRIDRNGIVTTILGTGVQGFSGDGGPAVQAQTSFPGSVAVDAVGNVYFGDTLANRVRRISPTGIVTTVVGTGAAASTGDGGPPAMAAVREPFGIEIDPYGNLYVIEAGSHVIRKVSGLLPKAPSFPPNGGTNGANFRTGLQFGSISSIFGVNLTNVQDFAAAPPGVFPLPLLVGGVSMTVNGVPAPIFAVLNQGTYHQINFLTPFESGVVALSPEGQAKGLGAGPGGQVAQVVVTNNGLSNAPVLVPVSQADPGIFVVGGAGEGAVTHLDNALVTAENPAAPGEILVVYCTGLGTVSDPPAAGQPAVFSQMPVFPSATVAGIASPVLFGGLAPNLVGLYQVNVMVANAAPSGIQQLVIIAPNGTASNSVPLAIQ